MLRLLIKNGLRVDFRKFVPFVVTVVVAVMIVSGTATVKRVFRDLAMTPMLRYFGGDTWVTKSADTPVFSIRGGVSVRMSKQLFRCEELLQAIGDQPVSQELHLNLFNCAIGGVPTQTAVYGVQRLTEVEPLRTSGGILPDFTQPIPWTDGPIPVAVSFGDPRVQLTIGEQFKLLVPSILPDGGGIPNLMGSEAGPGTDYLDYDHARTVTCEVKAIVSEQWNRGANMVYMPLRTLQDVAGGYDFVNSVYLFGNTETMSEVEQRAQALQAIAPKGFHFTPSTTIVGLTDEMDALEQHADRLLQMVFAISALMVVNVLVLILQHRRKQDAQLLFIGLKRSQLLLSVGWQVLLVSSLAVLLGLTLPLGGGVVAFRSQVLTKIPIGRFLALVPVSTLLSLLVAAVLLPRKTDTLEAMRND